MLGGGENGLSKLLQASYKLGGGQNGLSELLQASFMLCGSQNRLFKLLQASYTLGSIVKTDFQNFNKAHTRLDLSRRTSPLRRLKAWLQCYHVFQPDSWLLFDMKIQHSLLYILAPPMYLFLDYRRSSHMLLLHRRERVLPSIPEHPW